jgi:hypothetical protein
VLTLSKISVSSPPCYSSLQSWNLNDRDRRGFLGLNLVVIQQQAFSRRSADFVC